MEYIAKVEAGRSGNTPDKNESADKNNAVQSEEAVVIKKRRTRAARKAEAEEPEKESLCEDAGGDAE